MHLRRLILTLTLMLFLLSGCAYKNHMKQGDLLLQQGQYEAALNEYEAALAKKPRSEDAQRGAEDARNSLIAQLSEETRSLLDARDYPGALDAAFALENRLPDSPDVKKLLREVSERLQLEAADASSRAQWAKSLDFLMLTYDAFPEDRATLDPAIEQVKSTWTKELTEAATSAEAAGHLGDALLLHAQAALLTMAPENVSKRDELRARLLTDYSYPIVIKGKGKGVDRVLSSLQNAQDIPQNMSFHSSTKGLTPAASLNVSIKSPSFKTERSTSTRTARYKSGTQQVENPSYRNAQSDLERAQKDLYRYEDDLMKAERDVDRYSDQVMREGDTPGTSTGAEQSLSRARSDLERARDNVERARDSVRREQEDLNDTPPTIEEDVYSDLEYTVTTQRRIATLPGTVSITHSDKTAPIERSFSPSTSAQDESHGAYPIAGIAEDPLELPSDASLVTQLRGAVTNSAFAAADQSFQLRRKQVLEQAFAQEDEGERLHFYVIYILMDPTLVDERIIEEIATARGIPNAPQIINESKAK
jgi:tetratricopeptide (TPR) repeat protein